jgi:hypothetical protein
MWVDLHRTRHYDGAYAWLRAYTGQGCYGWHDFRPVYEPVRIGRHEACSAYVSRDGRFRVVADVTTRGKSVRIVQERHAAGEIAGH